MTDLERRLVNLAERIDVSSPETFRDEVLRRIETPRRRRRRGRLVVAVTFAAGSLVALPGPRSVLARWLGFDSVRIEPGPVPTLPTSMTERTLNPTTATRPELGPALALDEAGRASGLPVQLPSALGDPASVHVVDESGVTQVVAVYPASASLPDVGALVSIFAAEIEAGYFAKFVDEDTTVETLTIDGDPAIWLEGAPHQVAVVVNGEVVLDTLRLSTNTLLRQRGDVVLRIEASITRAEAVRIAETWEPAAG